MGKWQRPQVSGGGGAGEGSSWADREFSQAFPALAGWLGEGFTDEGHARPTGTLLVFCEGTAIKCCLKDRETNAVAFLTAGTWLGLLRACDEALASGDADWRAHRDKPQGRK